MEQDKLLNFVMGKEMSPIIKVIGVGGGGGNAVNHMYRQGIHDVGFVLCNTDYQAILDSPIQTKIQLGANITEGLGAGNKPEKARIAAMESLHEIEQVLQENTKMVFITAGMGGGTGTGAAPIVAKAAKDLGILTVGIVTIPFLFEGKKKIAQALEGVEEMSKHVDALLVINNEKLREIYPDFELSNAFAKADDVLTSAAKGIAEIITVTGYTNVDFADVNTIMKDGGVAIMNSGYASGEKRISQAIQNALESPLLNNNDVRNAKKILLSIYSSKTNQIKMEEVGEIHEFMEKMGDDIEVIWGATFDDSLGDEVKITIIATGFGINNITNQGVEKPKENVVYLHDNQTQENLNVSNSFSTSNLEQKNKTNTVHDTFDHYYGTSEAAKKDEKTVIALQEMDDEEYVEKLSKLSALKRRQGKDVENSFKPSNLSKLTFDDENKLKDKNDFLHNNVD